LDVWSDQQIATGEDWHESIALALENADVIVALITADFLASDFIMKTELRNILEGTGQRPAGKRVVPVIVKPSVIGLLPTLARYQAANSLSAPIAGMSEVDRESALVRVVESIVDMLGDLASHSLQSDSISSADIDEQLQAADLQSDDLRLLKQGQLGYWHMVHLRKLAAPEPFVYEASDTFKQELDELAKKEMIERLPGKGLRTVKREGGLNSDLHRHFQVTEKGFRYLRALGKLGLQRAQTL